MAQKGHEESSIPRGKSSSEYLNLKKKIANGLEKKHLKSIRFLCAKYIPRSAELTSGLDLMEYLEKEQLIGEHDVSFLIEILFRIQRYDLIKIVPGIPDRTYFENEILSGLRYFEGQHYRNFAVQLENQLSKDDLKDFKSYCADFARSTRVREKYVVDIFQKLEELDLVHDNNLTFLLMILKKMRAKGPYQQLKQIQSKNNNNALQGQEENLGANVQSEPHINDVSLELPEATLNMGHEVSSHYKIISNPNPNQPDYEVPPEIGRTVCRQSENSILNCMNTHLPNEISKSDKRDFQNEVPSLDTQAETIGQSEIRPEPAVLNRARKTDSERNQGDVRQSTVTEGALTENRNLDRTRNALSYKINCQPKVKEQLDKELRFSDKNMEQRTKKNAESITINFKDEHVKINTVSMNSEHTTPLMSEPEIKQITARKLDPASEIMVVRKKKVEERSIENAKMKNFEDEHAKIKAVSRNLEDTAPLLFERQSENIAAGNIDSDPKPVKIRIAPRNLEDSVPLVRENAAQSTCGIHPIQKSKPDETLAIVINEKEFPRYKPTLEEFELWEHCGLRLPRLDLKERTGSDLDVDKLSHVLKNCEGVDVCTYDNFPASSIRELLTDLSQGQVKRGKHRDLAKYDRLLFFILTHGEAGWIYGVDGFCIALSEVAQLFSAENCPSFAKKPKVVFPIACRVESPYFQLEARLEYSKLTEILSRASNLMVIYPTQRGCESFRWTKEGTVFVTQFLKAFTKDYPVERNLLDIIDEMVCAGLSANEECGQVPECLGSLEEEFSLRLMDSFRSFLNDNDMEVAGGVGKTKNE